MPGHDLALLIDAARAAGEIATTYSGKDVRRWEKPGDAGPVSEADLAVNELLETRLRNARPDYGWLSEESPDDPTRMNTQSVFIVDPIDGTRNFLEGGQTWAHALAVARRGEVTAAVIFLPRRGRLFAAEAGGGATLNGAPIKPSDRVALDGASLLAGHALSDPRHWRGPVPGFVRAHRPSLAYRMALVAQGRFDAMLTLRPSWEWDIAAGDLILREAGATITDRTGARLAFNNPHPALDGVLAAAGERLHRSILTALAPAPLA